MNDSNATFRDRLLDFDSVNPAYREEYERQVRAMVEQKLTGTKKWQIIGFIVLSLCLGVLFGALAVMLPKGIPWWGRLMFGSGSLFNLAFVAIYVRILKNGSLNLRKDDMELAWTGWGCVVVAGTIALVFTPKLPDRIAGVHILVCLLFFLVSAGVLLLRAFIERSELNTREKLLEIQYRLADLAEKIEGRQQDT